MSHTGKGYDINQTFIIEAQSSSSGDTPVVSACTAIYSNALYSCSGNTNIILGNGIISFNGNLYTNNNISGNTIYASTYYSGGTNLFNIIEANNITGGTFNNTTDTLTLNKKNNEVISVTGFSNFYTTGTTLIGNTLYFNRNDEMSAYTANLPSLSGDNTYVTGVTFTDNQLIIVRNDGVNLNAFINSFTGLTVNGDISGTTFYGDGSNLTGISTQDTFVTGGTYSNGTAIFTNNTGGTFNVSGFSSGSTSSTEFTGGTVSGATYFINGLTANTFSATTYQGLPLDVFATGLTLNISNYDLILTRNDGVSLTTNLGLLSSDVTITGGTYNPNTGVVTFSNNTGGTFSVSGFSSGMTDTTITSFSYDNANRFTISDSTGGTFTAIINSMTGLTVNGIFSATTYQGLPTDVYVTGGTYSAGTAVFTNNTGGTFNVIGFSTGNTSSIDYWTSGSSGNFSIKTINDSGLDATGDYAVAEGNRTNASGYASRAEGFNTIASGNYSHTEGSYTTAIGIYSHAGGTNTIASGSTSFVHGSDSTANGFGTIVLGNNITGNTDNTTYVNLLNIKTINSGRPINNLGYDSSGNIIIGITGGDTFTGGTVSGATIFINGLTANTFSAATYQGLVENLTLQDAGSSLTNTVYTMDLYANYPYIINSMTIQTSSGTTVGSVIINSTNVTGLAAVSGSTVLVTSAATANNTVAIGDKVTITTSGSTGLANLQANLKTTRI